MKAARLHEFGKPLVVEDVEMPEPGPGQVLIRVAACGACHSDIHIARGEWEAFKPRMPMPVILGHEVAGIVVKRGEDVHGLQEGDLVGVPWFFHTCGSCEYCRKDLEVFCISPQVTGVTVHGGKMGADTAVSAEDAGLVPGRGEPGRCCAGLRDVG